jgi:glycosylphosphatidylinositol transamidase
VLNTGLPHVLSALLTHYHAPTAQQYQLTKSFSLLLLGMFLSSLATLNFSLAFLVGLLASPLTFMRPWPRLPAMRFACLALLHAIAPTTVLLAAAGYWNVDAGHILARAAFGWNVWGMYTSIIVWCVWWPAWLVAAVGVLGVPSTEKKVKTA